MKYTFKRCGGVYEGRDQGCLWHGGQRENAAEVSLRVRPLTAMRGVQGYLHHLRSQIQLQQPAARTSIQTHYCLHLSSQRFFFARGGECARQNKLLAVAAKISRIGFIERYYEDQK